MRYRKYFRRTENISVAPKSCSHRKILCSSNRIDDYCRRVSKIDLCKDINNSSKVAITETNYAYDISLFANTSIII